MNLLKYKDFHDYGLPHNKADNPTKIMENINYLYNKMKQCTRNVTYFDLYKINTIITQDSEFDAQVNALEPHSTAIINTNITTANQVYSPGDMIIKNTDGTTSTIIAQRGGIFYPKTVQKFSSDDNNFSYNFSFYFRPVAPVADTTSEDTLDEGATSLTVDFAETLLFKGLSGGVPASPYNLVTSKLEGGWVAGDRIRIKISDLTMTINIDADHVDKTIPIDPIVHCYSDKEEIYMDQTILYKTPDAENTKATFDITLQKTDLCTKVVIK